MPIPIESIVEGDGEDLMPIIEALLLLASGRKDERATRTIAYYAQYCEKL